MADPTNDAQLDDFLELRKPGAHLEEDVVADDFVLMLGVDLVNFPKFPRVDDDITYPKRDLDIRQELDTDSGAELPDYSGEYRADLRFTDFSRDALATKFIPWSAHYLQICVDGWAAEIAKRYGAETMAEIEWTAWNDQVVPELERMKQEFLPPGRTTSTRTNWSMRPIASKPASSTRGSSRRAPTLRRCRSPSSSPGCSAATSTCCSASRRGRRRSRCATASTSCSTSSGRSGARPCSPG